MIIWLYFSLTALSSWKSSGLSRLIFGSSSHESQDFAMSFGTELYFGHLSHVKGVHSLKLLCFHFHRIKFILVFCCFATSTKLCIYTSQPPATKWSRKCEFVHMLPFFQQNENFSVILANLAVNRYFANPNFPIIKQNIITKVNSYALFCIVHYGPHWHTDLLFNVSACLVLFRTKSKKILNKNNARHFYVQHDTKS